MASDSGSDSGSEEDFSSLVSQEDPHPEDIRLQLRALRQELARAENDPNYVWGSTASQDTEGEPNNDLYKEELRMEIAKIMNLSHT